MKEVEKTLEVVSSENNNLSEGSVIRVVGEHTNQFSPTQTLICEMITGSHDYLLTGSTFQIKRVVSGSKWLVVSACESMSDRVELAEL